PPSRMLHISPRPTNRAFSGYFHENRPVVEPAGVSLDLRICPTFVPHWGNPAHLKIKPPTPFRTAPALNETRFSRAPGEFSNYLIAYTGRINERKSPGN